MVPQAHPICDDMPTSSTSGMNWIEKNRESVHGDKSLVVEPARPTARGKRERAERLEQGQSHLKIERRMIWRCTPSRTCEELQENHTKAVHFTTLSDNTTADVLRALDYVDVHYRWVMAAIVFSCDGWGGMGNLKPPPPLNSKGPSFAQRLLTFSPRCCAFGWRSKWNSW